MVRGVSYGGTVYAVTDFNASGNRNLITEQGMNIGGEPKVYDGTQIVTGSISAVYRDDFAAIGAAINALLSTGGTITPKALVASDEYGGLSFPTSFINSLELTLQLKDFARTNMGYVATGSGTPSTVSTTPTTYADPVPIFWACGVTVDSSVIKSTGFSMKIEAPIDQDYYVIGSKSLEAISQSGNGTLTGSISFGPTEWGTIQDAFGTCGDLGDIVVNLSGQSAANCATSLIRTITIEDAVTSDASFSGQNRSKFTKTLNWRAPVSDSINEGLFA